MPQTISLSKQQTTSGKRSHCCQRWSLRIRKRRILRFFCCFPVTSVLILSTIILSLASIDSPAELFPLADLFWHCLFWNCLHSAMLHGTMSLYLNYWSARSMMVVAALCHGESISSFVWNSFFYSFSTAFAFNLLFEFRLVLNFSSTLMLFLSWRSLWFYF